MFRDRIKIYKDVADEGEITPDWEALGCLPANINNVSGGETLRGKQILSEVNYVVEIRHISCIDSEMRIEVLTGPHKGKILNINVINTIERRKPLRPFLMQLQCTASE